MENQVENERLHAAAAKQAWDVEMVKAIISGPMAQLFVRSNAMQGLPPVVDVVSATDFAVFLVDEVGRARTRQACGQGLKGPQ